MDRHREERERLEEDRERSRVVKVDKKVLEKEVEKLVHQQAMKMDAALRLKETEVQRRRRHSKDATRGTGAHTAMYSDAMPATGTKFIDMGKTHVCADVRSLTKEDVEDWRRNTQYKGLRPEDLVCQHVTTLLHQ